MRSFKRILPEKGAENKEKLKEWEAKLAERMTVEDEAKLKEHAAKLEEWMNDIFQASIHL